MQVQDEASGWVRRLCAGIVVFWGVVGFVQIGKAATITLERPPPSDQQIITCEIRLNGIIEEHDLKKLTQVLRLFELTEQPTLCLNSSGGSYEEGLLIAEFIVDRHIPTAVDADADCLSACAIVFLAGNGNNGRSIRLSRRLHVAGKLGFKEPYDEGLSAIKRLFALHPELILSELIIDMTRYASDKSLFISTVGQAIEYSVGVIGVREPRDFGEVTSEMWCNICDNANHGNGQCVKTSRQRDVNFDNRLQLLDVTLSFLHYGPEGGQRCIIATTPLSQGMLVQIRGAGKDAVFQNIFFYSWSTLLISLPLDETLQSREASH